MTLDRRFPLLALIVLLGGAVLLATIGHGASASGAGGDPPGLDRAIAAKEANSERLLARAGIVGTAVGIGDQGAEVTVLATRRGVSGIPSRLNGVPVSVVVSGPLNALHHRPGHSGGPPGNGGGGDDNGEDGEGGDEPSEPEASPIGVSTGNANECSAGTIGARVKDSAGAVYALSNNHVYARENAASIGEEVLQPGLYDTNCVYDPDNHLGNLSAFEQIAFDGSENRIDAAIASTTTALLGNSTPAGGYGTPASATVSPSVGQAVQKYGRTTALTRGLITGVNARVQVGFSSGTALFVDQIIVESQRPGFIRAGDSGSLLVTDPAANPVGLLFAGNVNGKLAVANEIDRVLEAFDVTVDGD